MTDTVDETTPAAGSGPATRKRAGGLSSMLLADLKAMAGGLGVSGAGSMKKAQLIEAIKAAQSGSSQSGSSQPGSGQPGSGHSAPPATGATTVTTRTTRAQRAGSRQRTEQQPDQQQVPKAEQRVRAPEEQAPEKQTEKQAEKQASQRGQGNQDKQNQDKQKNQNDQANQGGDDEDGGGRRNRRRRQRDRDRARPVAGGARQEPDTTVLDDDVLVPAAGILDVLDNYAFVRTSGYLPGAEDVYLSLSMVRRFGLRRGDAIVGQVRQPREGERKEKFNPMVKVDSVNGADPDEAVDRVEFDRLTPVYPTERLRMETDPANLVGRVIDLAAPIGKGQRGLVVAPARAGRTTLLRSIAASVATNNPECHLMMVLVDERPEEVTDVERSVKGEVVSSTFERQPADHTTLAELALERAKRLVELGHDVVVLLDGITRLARAYNLSTPASGRVLPGGVDSAALHPPKRFFAAARNVENGGSLTIIATATVESGSRVDEVIFEELEGTANMELRLRGELADRQLFPAVDVVASGTRREELLVGEQETAIVRGLRGMLAGLESRPALEDLLGRLRASQTNIELLTRVQRSTS